MFFGTTSEANSFVIIAISCGIYFAYLLLFNAVREPPRSLLVCIAFIVFLVLNVAGCRKIIGAYSSVT